MHRIAASSDRTDSFQLEANAFIQQSVINLHHAQVALQLQVTLAYMPLASSPGMRMVKEVDITVKSAPAVVPHLPASIVTDRSCFNVRPPVQRTIIPAAALTLCDRYTSSTAATQQTDLCCAPCKASPVPLCLIGLTHCMCTCICFLASTVWIRSIWHDCFGLKDINS